MAGLGEPIKTYVFDFLSIPTDPHIPSDPHIPGNPVTPAVGIQLIVALQHDSLVEVLGVLPPSDIG